MDYGSNVTDVRIYELEKRVREVYTQAEHDISRKLDDFIAAYKTKEAVHLKDVAEGRWTQEQFDNWVKGQVFQEQQWKSKRDQILSTLSDANGVAARMMNGYRNDVFAFNANYQAYQLEHGAGVNFGFQLYDPAAVANLIQNNPQILPQWKIDEPKDYTWNYTNVNNAIAQGIIQGERLDQIAQRLATGLSSKNMKKMIMFARTGMTQAQNSGRLTRLGEAKSMGLNVQKQWMATLDGHTRWQHADLDGQKRGTNEYFVVGQYKIMYPGDPKAHPSMVYNCRCTLVGSLVDYPAKYDRYDNIDGKPIKNMTYREWEKAKGKQYTESKTKPLKPELNQVSIGMAKTVDEINALLNSPGLFKIKTKKDPVFNKDTMKWEIVEHVVPNSAADLTGCDLDSAKAIASSYEQVFAKYPNLKGKFNAPNAHPVGMGNSTYAWCSLMSGGVEVNPSFFSKWSKVESSYNNDVKSGWHPKGTTAESIVVHELGHAIDGLLSKEDVLGKGTSVLGKKVSSYLKPTIMHRCGLTSSSYDVGHNVSEYATKNPAEWLAECFAEYITSASPRPVATELGKELEKLIGKVN